MIICNIWFQAEIFFKKNQVHRLYSSPRSVVWDITISSKSSFTTLPTSRITKNHGHYLLIRFLSKDCCCADFTNNSTTKVTTRKLELVTHPNEYSWAWLHDIRPTNHGACQFLLTPTLHWVQMVENMTTEDVHVGMFSPDTVIVSRANSLPFWWTRKQNTVAIYMGNKLVRSPSLICRNLFRHVLIWSLLIH